MLEATNLRLMPTSSNDIRRGNMSTHHQNKEQVSSRTNKDGKEYVKQNIPGQNNIPNILVRANTKATDVIEQEDDGSGPRQGTLAGYEITDGHCVLPLGNRTKGKDQDEDWRDVGETT